MNRLSFIKNLIGVPFIGSAILDLTTSKKSLPVEVSKFSIPTELNLLANEGELRYVTIGIAKGLWMYNNNQWRIVATRAWVDSKDCEPKLSLTDIRA